MKKSEFVREFVKPLIIQVNKGVINWVGCDSTNCISTHVKRACGGSNAVHYGEYDLNTSSILVSINLHSLGEFYRQPATEENMKRLKQSLKSLAKEIYKKLTFPIVVPDGNYNMISKEESVETIVKVKYVVSLNTESYEEAVKLSQSFREIWIEYILIWNKEDECYDLYKITK